METLSTAKNGKINVADADIMPSHEIGELFDQYLTEDDRRYMARTGKSIALLTTTEANIEERIKELKRTIERTPEAKELKELQADLKSVRGQLTEKTTKVTAIVERAFQDVRKGTRLYKKLQDVMRNGAHLLTSGVMKQLTEGK